jgi:hypothetical protein
MNAAGTEVARHGFRQCTLCHLGGSKRSRAGDTAPGSGGADDKNGSMGRFDHCRNNLSGGQKQAQRVGAPGLFEISRTDLINSAPDSFPGVIDENLWWTQLLVDFEKGFADSGLVADIAGEGDNFRKFGCEPPTKRGTPRQRRYGISRLNETPNERLTIAWSYPCDDADRCIVLWFCDLSSPMGWIGLGNIIQTLDPFKPRLHRIRGQIEKHLAGPAHPPATDLLRRSDAYPQDIPR